MALFDELRAEYGQAVDRVSAYRSESHQFIRAFTQEFRVYIGAPEFYDDIANGRKKSRYVQLKKVEEDSDAEEPTRPNDLLTVDDEGRWICALLLTVDRDANTFPKKDFRFSLNFVLLADGTCDMKLGERQFSLRKDNADDKKAVFNQMI